MAMVVKNNMSAVRTLSTLNKNNTALQDSLSKVSSGLKIDTAKDDASGYAISERMRVQIRSLDQANQNSQNASSLMKNAEGAVERTIDILRTLKQKAIDAASDTNTDDDRATIQKELDQLIDQIDDNALITFNGKYLLEGSRAQSGSAVATHMTNNSLNTETNLETALINLKNRNGESLEINTGDRVTVSFVMGGKTYVSTLTSVSRFTKLGSIYNMLDEAKNGTTPAMSATQVGHAFSTITASSGDTSNLPAGSVSFAADMKVLGLSETAEDYTNDIKGDGSTSEVGTFDSTTGSNSDISFMWQGMKFTLGSGTATSETFKLGGAEITFTRESDGTSTSKISLSGFKYYTYGGSSVSTDTIIGNTPAGKELVTADGMNAITFKAAAEGLEGQISGLSISISDSEGNVKKATNTALDNFKTSIYAANETADGAVSFQLGSAANQAVKVGLMDMRSEALGLKGRDGTTIKITTRAAANAAIAAFDNALNKALDQQTTIGAISSRLDYTASNLTTSSENVQAAESTIRDADMAKEMTNYTKNNVLLQAAQSMLAQANQNSSAVLSLLQ